MRRTSLDHLYSQRSDVHALEYKNLLATPETETSNFSHIWTL